MFNYCTKLIGAQGTAYDANYTDKTRAHIDGGSKDPGYLWSTYEPYIVYTSSNTTLTFLYDEQRSYRRDSNYLINENRTWLENAANVTTVVFDKSFQNYYPTTTGNWFAEMEKLTTFRGLEYLNTNKVGRMGGMFMGCKSLTELDLSNFDTHRVTNMNHMFNGCSALERIFVSDGWSADNVTASELMFTGCTSLKGGVNTQYDVSHVEADYACIDRGTLEPGYLTGPSYTVYDDATTTLTFYNDGKRSNKTGTIFEMVSYLTSTTKPGWFSYRNRITKVVFDASFKSARPVLMHQWFCMPNLETITNIGYLNTSEVRNMVGTFSEIAKLTNLNLQFFNTENVENMVGMFQNCMLEELDLSSFNTQNVTDMREMFKDCTNLKTIVASQAFTTDKVRNSTDMFTSCTKLVGSAGTRYDANHTDKTYARVDGGTSRPGYFSDLGYVVISNDGKTMTFYYDGYRNTRQGTVFTLNKNFYVVPEWAQDGQTSDVTTVYFDSSFKNARPMYTCGWFDGMSKLTEIKFLNYLNTSETIHMGSMFDGCRSLTTLDLTSFDTHKVKYMGWMFRSCPELTTIYVSDGWDTANVEDTGDMFWGSTKLVGGLGTAFNANYVDGTYACADTETQKGYMTLRPYVVLDGDVLTFYCDGKKDKREGEKFELNTFSNTPDWVRNSKNKAVVTAVIDPSFVNARPTTTSNWFYGMSNMTALKGLEYLNTSKVDNMSYMFYITYLTSLDLSYFDTSKVKNMEQMFSQSPKLKTIYVGNKWSTASVTNSTKMFQSCSVLKGGAGTTYNANYVDKTRAHIDGGTSNPGYLTGVSTESYKVFVGGKAITGANYKLITPGNGFTAIKSGTVTFDPATMTLTLKDAVIDYTESNSAISSSNNVPLNIVVEGENKITSSERHGIFGYSDMTISGSGSITVDAASCAVYVYNTTDASTLTIRDCSLTATGKFGITGYDGSKETLVVDNATIHATGSTVSLGNFQTLELKGCIITQPKGAYLQKHLLDADGKAITTEVIIEPGFLRGDVNADGQVGIGDIVAITNVMAGIETNPDIVDRANVNEDESVGIGDIVTITNIMAGIE
jgi:surface protein